jgi:hypothetical protein
MCKQLSALISLVMILGMVGSLGAAEPFSLLPTFDGHVGNDGQTGPNASATTGTGMEARNIATRRRVAYVVYDISSVKKPGLLFQNVSFSNYGHDVGTVDVYGVLESQESLLTSGLTWNNAPGVKNDPAPPLDTDVVLDLADVTGILLTFDTPVRGTRASTETSQAVADFLNSDTNGIVAFMFAPRGSASAIVRTVEMGADGGTRLEGEVGGLPLVARLPYPADEAGDVERTIVLGWAPGATAVGHNVYFGTSAADVNAAKVGMPLDVLVSAGQDANTYEPPTRLEFGQTYWWRVDEVNAPPDATVFRGTVWSFTVEPFVYQMQNIIATASSSATGVAPENTVNGSGLDAEGLHSTAETAMWVSAKNAPQPAWIQYEFDGVYKLYELWVWNYNHSFESTLGFGFNDVTIEYSVNGTDWTALGDVQFAQAPAADGYAHLPPVDMQGVPAQYVRLTANSNFSGMSQFGLSEVRFFYIPAHPREPKPAAGAAAVDVDTMLSWRAGREAASHTVYLSTEQQAVAEGTALAGTSDVSRFDPGPLNYGQTYFWRVTEVNEAETIPTWDGALWSFATTEYLVVDDFESYNEEENQGTRIYETWIDGYADGSSGSTVGYIEPPFAEQTIVHGGEQSMPMDYNNINAPFFSEAVRTWDTPRDWSAHGADELVLYFRGNRIGFLERSAGTFTMSGVGTDIYGTSDQFQFAYKSLSGDGTIIARVDSVDNADPWSKAGVMVREGLEPGARFAAVYATPGNGVRFQARLLSAGDATSDTSVATDEQKALNAPVWIKLERTGMTVSCYYSTDGTKWTPMSWNPQTLALNGPVYIGLAVTSHVAGVAVTGEFSGVSVTGATGSWRQAAIGVPQPDNDADRLYLAVEDSAKHLKVIQHPDPQAVLLDTWQRWSIPLTDLQAGGVNLQKVKSLYIGVGDRDHPVQAGAGRIYIDDIGVGHAAATP